MASEFPRNDPPTPVPPPPGEPRSGMIGRVQRILLSPAAEWDRIDAEPMTAKGVFMGWVVPLAAIGPICGFIGMQLFGINLLMIHFKPPLVSSLVQAILGYIGALIGVWVLALVINALAPSFGAAKNQDQAMKVAGFSYTASFIGGVFQIFPPLAIIGLLFALYSFYLLWVGLPKLMKPPADKAVGYFAVTIVVAIVVYIVIGAIIGAISHPLMTAGTAGAYQPV